MENSGFVTKEDRDEVESDFPLTKLFELWCPIYMSYGMSYDDYWNGEPRMCKFYKEAYDIRRKRDDEDAWWQGLYIYDAFCRVSPVLNAFAKNGTKPLPYVDKPYTQSDKYKQLNEKLSDEEEQKLIENERLKARVTFHAWARAGNKQKKNKEKIEEGGR